MTGAADGGGGQDSSKRPSAEDLEQLILGDERSVTAADIAGMGDSTGRNALRLWRALGFPDVAMQDSFIPGDLHALGQVLGAVDDGVVDMDTLLSLTRAAGQSMSRLADWQMTSILPRIEARAAEIGRREALMEFFEANLQMLEESLVYAWRRHLAAAVARGEGVNREEMVNTIEVTVAFADLVSFTELSNSIGESRVGDMIEEFENRCQDEITFHHGRLIKSLGDSVLFVNGDVEAAFSTAEGIIEKIGRDSDMPDVRIGMASGLVAIRLGDVFGPPVNMAARLTPLARRNRIIIDDATAERLPSDRFGTRTLPPRQVRGFGIVEPISVRRLRT